jgi:hypothetical protein
VIDNKLLIYEIYNFSTKKATFLCIIAEKAVSLQANNNSYETQHSFSNTDYIRLLGVGSGESAVP